MLIAILLGLLLAFAAPLLYRLLGKYLGWLLLLYPLAVFGLMLRYWPLIQANKTISEIYNWVPALGIDLSFYLDGLGLFFALLISGFGVLIVLYAAGYLKGHALLGRFYLYLLLFMVAMLGMVTAGNIWVLFVFWELTSLSSYLLIGFSHQDEAARKSAWQALLVTGGGGLALMGGLILLSQITGTISLVQLSGHNSLITSHALYVPAVLLIMLGAFTKSAQFPFHFWLPNAMKAPTPVSAYLHSATMVKAGIFLLARLSPALSGPGLWHYTLLAVGSLTALTGAFLALTQTDLKAILAYTTISALGLLVLLTGLGTAEAIQAMVVFLLAHALYKGTLFLVAGNLDHATGTRQLHGLGNLGSKLPVTATAAGLAALSMAGMIPFFGFIGKEFLYEAAYQETGLKLIFLVVAMVAGLVYVVVALQLGFGLFWQNKTINTTVHHPENFYGWLPPLVLAVTGLGAGLFANNLVTPLLGRAAGVILSKAASLKLALWHGFTPVLGLSGITLLLGLLLFRFVKNKPIEAGFIKAAEKFGPARLYEAGLAGLLSGAGRLTSFIQNGYLRNYVGTVVGTLTTLVLAVLWLFGPELDLSNRLYQLNDLRLYELVVFVLVIPALLLLFITGSRLTSIAILGMIGYAVALFFILFGAPDVAATQLLIETLTVVLFVLLLHKLPAFRKLPFQGVRVRHLAVSLLFGATITYVTLLVKGYTAASALKKYFGENSYLLGKGRNVVNVIIVDFRALDTLGEIVVLVVAATGIFTMLKLRLDKKERL